MDNEAIYSIYINNERKVSYFEFDTAKERYSEEVTNYLQPNYSVAWNHLPDCIECCEIREMAVVVKLVQEVL